MASAFFAWQAHTPCVHVYSAHCCFAAGIAFGDCNRRGCCELKCSLLESRIEVARKLGRNCCLSNSNHLGSPKDTWHAHREHVTRIMNAQRPDVKCTSAYVLVSEILEDLGPQPLDTKEILEDFGPPDTIGPTPAEALWGSHNSDSPGKSSRISAPSHRTPGKSSRI